jgi:hypothetical protein
MGFGRSGFFKQVTYLSRRFAAITFEAPETFQVARTRLKGRTLGVAERHEGY